LPDEECAIRIRQRCRGRTEHGRGGVHRGEDVDDSGLDGAGNASDLTGEICARDRAAAGPLERPQQVTEGRGTLRGACRAGEVEVETASGGAKEIDDASVRLAQVAGERAHDADGLEGTREQMIDDAKPPGITRLIEATDAEFPGGDAQRREEALKRR